MITMSERTQIRNKRIALLYEQEIIHQTNCVQCECREAIQCEGAACTAYTQLREIGEQLVAITAYTRSVNCERLREHAKTKGLTTTIYNAYKLYRGCDEDLRAALSLSKREWLNWKAWNGLN